MSGAGDDPEFSRLGLLYDEESRVLTWEIMLSDESSESIGSHDAAAFSPCRLVATYHNPSIRVGTPLRCTCMSSRRTDPVDEPAETWGGVYYTATV